MPSPYTLYQVDSFTTEKFKGNPAGVVSNADGLSELQMQAIAREMNCSETAFVFSSQDPTSHDIYIRYFTPTVEVPVCGHATIAAHYVLAKERGLDRITTFRTKTGIGVLDIEIQPRGDSYKIVMTEGEIEFQPILTRDQLNRILEALGLTISDWDPRFPAQIVSTGHSKVLIGIKSRETLNRLSPDFRRLAYLSPSIGSNGYFVFTFDSDEAEILTYGRMFAPAIGIDEDPVTGNAHGPLGAYIAWYGLVPPDNNRLVFWGKQGETMNRPGCVEVRVDVENNLPRRVQIAGEAVIVFRTELVLF